MNITVNAVNDTPVIISMAPDSAFVGEEYTYFIEVLDLDGDDLNYSLVNAPDSMKVSNNGTVSWIPENGTTSSGEVILIVSDGFATASENFVIIVTGSVGIDDMEKDNILLYPNPTYNAIYLKGFEGNALIIIYNIEGKSILRKETTAKQPISVCKLVQGVYMMKIIQGNKTFVKRFIKFD